MAFLIVLLMWSEKFSVRPRVKDRYFTWVVLEREVPFIESWGKMLCFEWLNITATVLLKFIVRHYFLNQLEARWICLWSQNLAMFEFMSLDKNVVSSAKKDTWNWRRVGKSQEFDELLNKLKIRFSLGALFLGNFEIILLMMPG